MSRQTWGLFYGLVIVLTFVTVSCSRPGQDLQGTNPSKVSAAETPSKSDVVPAPPEQPKPTEDVKKKPAEPARRAETPRPSPVVAQPPAAPEVVPQQSAPGAPPPPAPIVIPGPQATIPAPPPLPPPEPTTKQVTIPAGTEVYIRMIDTIDTEKSHPDETFRASLDQPIVVDNQTIVPRRSDVFVKVVEVQTAGKLKGKSELKVQLDRIFIGKQSYTVTSNEFTETGSSEGKKAARNIGIGAAVGGVLGGILGGTKGAVIGAGAGGGGGAVLTKPDQLRINSETQLLFKLENPLDVTISTAPASTAPARFSTGGSDGPAKLAPPDRPSRSTSPTSSSSDNDLSGTWTVTTDGPQYANLQLSLRQNGNNLQGSITDPRGSGTLPIRGSVSGNYVTFSTQSQYGGYNSQMQFSGAVQGDSMQGTVTLPRDTGYGSAGGSYPGGGYPGGGYPGGGRTRTGRTGGGNTQVHWNAQRN